MIVGHLPFLEKLTSYLVTGDEEELVLQFPTAGIVCFYKDGQKCGSSESPTNQKPPDKPVSSGGF